MKRASQSSETQSFWEITDIVFRVKMNKTKISCKAILIKSKNKALYFTELRRNWFLIYNNKLLKLQRFGTM